MAKVRFLEFELDLATTELRRAGTTVPLERQPGIALAHLAARAGTLVTREELRRAIWPEEVHVDFDRGLNYCIRQARAALGDGARQPACIETIPRQGYRFIAPIAACGQDAPASGPARARRRSQVIAAAAAALVLAILWDARIAGPAAKSRHHAAAVAAAHAVHDFLF